jgi:hypothetical protein
MAWAVDMDVAGAWVWGQGMNDAGSVDRLGIRRDGEPAKISHPLPVLVSLAHTTPTDCTANATAGGYDCVVGGQMVHVNATANVTQVQIKT